MKIPHRRTFRRSLALLSSVFLLLGLGAAPAFAEGYSDTDGHWGASVIEKWSEYDVLRGNGDGTFAPDRDMSVAELATVLVNAFGYTATGSAQVSPAVPAWATDNVQKAVTAGVISSDETGLTLTRELAAKILAAALDVAPAAGATSFPDDGDVSTAYKPYVKALSALGVFKGDAGGNFLPQKGFTRAEVMQVLDNTVTDIVRADKAASSEKSLIVNTPDVELTAGTVKGDLIIGQGVGDGDITLTNVKIEGRLIVYGGGKSSVHIRGNSDVPNVVTNKTFGESVRISVEGAANVGTVSVVAGSGVAVAGNVSKIEVVPAAEVTSSGEIATAAVADATDVEIVSGTVAEIVIQAENVVVALDNGATVASLVVESAGAEITVAAGATVTEATVAASDVTIEGSGKVESVTVTEDSAGGVTITVPDTQVKNESSESVSAGGDKTVDAGTTDTTPAAPTSPGSSGSGSSSGGSSTADTVAPVLSAGSVSRTSDAAATIGFTTDEAGTAYYLVEEKDATAPTFAETNSLGAVSAEAVADKPITLTAGAKDIYVFVKDAAGNVSAGLKIAAAAYVAPPTYGITLSQTGTLTFAEATEGYTGQPATTITVTNSGNQATGALTAALSGANPSGFTLSTASIGDIAAGAADTFTVNPATGLAAGTYTAAVTVSGGNSVSASFDVSFTVISKAKTLANALGENVATVNENDQIVTLSGEATVSNALTVPSGVTLVVPSGKTLIVAAALTVDGTLTVNGALTINNAAGGKLAGKGASFTRDATTLTWFGADIFTSGTAIIAFVNSFEAVASGGSNPESDPLVAATTPEKPSMVGVLRVNNGSIGKITYPYNNSSLDWNGSVTDANKWWLMWNGDFTDGTENSVFADGNGNVYWLTFEAILSSQTVVKVSFAATVADEVISSYTITDTTP